MDRKLEENTTNRYSFSYMVACEAKNIYLDPPPLLEYSCTFTKYTFYGLQREKTLEAERESTLGILKSSGSLALIEAAYGVP